MRDDPRGIYRLQHILNADKATKVRMQLVVLLHAQKYQQVDDSAHIRCTVPFCQTGRDVWRHISNCKLDEECTDARCKTSRQILAHWESCSKNQTYCKVCTPLKVVKFRKPKRFEVPDCLAARATIDHYKECTSMECIRCGNVKDLRRKLYGSRGLVKRRVCHSALLKHSCRCQDRTCQIPMCIKMKRVLTHTNICQGKTAQSMVCQDIATFCLNHAIVCTEKDCILSTHRVNDST